MLNSKLIQLLSSITKSEFTSFSLFCQSPYFNENERAKNVVAYLKEIHPNYTDENTARDKLFDLFFPSEKYNEQRVRQLFSDVTVLLESFFAVQAFQKNKVEHDQFLLNELNKRKQHKFFLQKLDESFEELDKKSMRDSDYYYLRYRLNISSYKYLTTYRADSLDGGLQNLVDNLDAMYLLQKLKYTCEMLNRKNILQTEYKFNFLNADLTTIEKSDFISIPAIAIYYYILQTLLDFSNEQAYIKAKQVFIGNTSDFSKEEQHDIYTFFQNYCIRKINTGSSNFLLQTFDNYSEMLNQEIILDNGVISHSDFKNIVTNALRMEKYEWTESFILKYKSMLEKTFRNDAISYNLSRLLYSKKEYKNALRNLQQVEFIDVYYNLDAKVLLLKIYYDTNAEEALYSLLSSFKIFLKRNKAISDYQYAIYSNFLRYIRRLYLIKMGGKGKLKDIQEDILVNKNVADLQWIQQKINDLNE